MHIKKLHKQFNNESEFAGYSAKPLKSFAKSLWDLGGHDGEEARRWIAAKGIKV